MEERARRIGANEAVFRAVNDRILALNESFAEYSGLFDILCECGDLGCAMQLSLAPSEYEYIRSDPTWFAVIPGHEIAEVERVVSSRSGYEIVQKHPGPAADQARASVVS